MTSPLSLSAVRALALLTIGIFMTNCASNSDPNVEEGETFGSAEVALTVPLDTECIRIIVTGPSSTEVRDFDVLPGETRTFTLSGLPLGSDIFEGEAYDTSCAAIAPGQFPVWVTDQPVLATVTTSPPVNVHLTFVRNGTAIVDGFFEEDLSNAGPVVFDSFSFPSDPGFVPGPMVFDAEAGILYVADQAGLKIQKFDRNLVSQGTFPILAGLTGMALDPRPGSKRLFMAYAAGGVEVKELVTETTVCTLSVGGGPNVTLNQTTDKLYVTVATSLSLEVFDASSNCPAFESNISGLGNFPVGVGVDEFTNRVYVPIHHAQEVVVIDGASNVPPAFAALNPTPPIAVLGDLSSIAVDPFSHRLYVGNFGETLNVVDTGSTGTGPYVANPPNPPGLGLAVGHEPISVVADAFLDRAYASSKNFVQIGVVTSGALDTPVGPTDLGMIPAAVAVDNLTHCFYVASHPTNPTPHLVKICEPARRAMAVLTLDNTIDGCAALLTSGAVAVANALHDDVDDITAASDASGRASALAALSAYATSNAPASCAPGLIALATGLVDLLDSGI